ncbi:LytR/AlgR family response regulator transcription factor [Spirosoma oryzicola]|uniref:LytR/AlgR family response regulator transcription factor n=1 Tax=Spirosoma oryzicola TaxID=2898794 RepID=UPI001E546FAB|nr:response regulator transcription factor [Spirosoma oryzicola]UHG94925.1 response regulator transcription factor [Spirosoma oryzicola]
MERELTCLIVDDEPLARELIKKFVARVPTLSLLGESSNAIEAIAVIHNQQPDIIFLDVDMPEMTGIELLKSFTAARPQVIMTTAYPGYALEGFEYDVTDYLLKPIPFDRFLKAINRVRDRINNATPFAQPAPVNEPAAGVKKDNPARNNKFLWVKEDKKMVNVNTDDILYVEGMKDYVKIFLSDKLVITHITMSRMERLLPENEFIRVNRSYIVRRSAIRAVNGNTIETINKKEIPIGISYRDSIKDITKD